MDEMDDLLNAFLEEAAEYISSIDNDLVQLEKTPDNEEIIKNIFRAIHTVKGTCGMFGLTRLEKVSHAAEDVLVKLRSKDLQITTEIVTQILNSVDAIKLILDALSETGKEPEGDDQTLITTLRSYLQNTNKATAPAEDDAHPAEASSPDDVVTNPEANSSVAARSDEKVAPDLEVAPAQSSPSQEVAKAGGQEVARKAPATQSLRVNLDVLDQIMNLVGELVLSRNQLIEQAKGDDESKYYLPIQQLNRVTSDLQEAVMLTRMQPIGNAWAKLPRIVRDLSIHSGKEVELEMLGQDTEVDRQILQAISDPLTHCVRNSIDHGLESPQDRVARGKSANGKLTLNAFQEGGYIIIEIKDDGAGMNVNKIREKAVERGLLSEEKAKALSEQQVVNLVFEPGFSTADKVTEISGRGVGMDMVRTNIEKIGGRVNLISHAGVGTTVQIKIPLTLAIISALIVNSGQDEKSLFAIPQVGVVELVRISAENRKMVDHIHGSPVLRLRDQLLPLVDLADILGFSVERDYDTEDLSVVVAHVGDQQFGLVVDDVNDTQEIVVKPAGRLSRDINLFSGTTILGDGSVILILDIAKISEKIFTDHVRDELSEHDDNKHSDYSSDLSTLLLFNSGEDKAPVAVPLSLVSRLEEFNCSNVETSGGHSLIQYRGGLLPLLSMAGSSLMQDEKDKFSAIIFSENGYQMGLVVHEILDIVNAKLEVDSTFSHGGVLGSCIIEGKATEILDTSYYLKQAHPSWFERRAELLTGQKRNVLVIDDSQFFANLIKTFLESEGFHVTWAKDGAEAQRILKNGSKSFDFISCDMEMPNLNGIEFGQWLQKSEFAKIPAVAMTSLDSQEQRQQAAALGFKKYLIKFNQSELLNAIFEHLPSDEASNTISKLEAA